MNILHIEDEPVYQKLVKSAFKKTHESVKFFFAKTFKEAESLVTKNPNTFSAVILDLRLPDAAGLECLERASKFNLPIVIFTNDKDEDLVQNILKTGHPVEYMFKDGFNSEGMYQRIFFAIARQNVTTFKLQNLDSIKKYISLNRKNSVVFQ